MSFDTPARSIVYILWHSSICLRFYIVVKCDNNVCEVSWLAVWLSFSCEANTLTLNWIDKMKLNSRVICIAAMAHELFMEFSAFLIIHTQSCVLNRSGWRIKLRKRGKREEKFQQKIPFVFRLLASFTHSKYLEHNDKELCAHWSLTRTSSFASSGSICKQKYIPFLVKFPCVFLFHSLLVRLAGGGSQHFARSLLLICCCVVYAQRRWNQNFLESPPSSLPPARTSH